MVARVQKTNDAYTITLTPEMMAELNLSEGGEVEVHSKAPSMRVISVADALRAFEETLPQHEAAYRELAK